MSVLSHLGVDEELDENDKVDDAGVNNDDKFLCRDLTLKEVDSLVHLVVVIHHVIGDHMVDNNRGPGLIILATGKGIPGDLRGDLDLVHDDDEDDHLRVVVIVGVAKGWMTKVLL